MNDLQRKELELLKCFIDVCKKLDLNYYLVCGTALGAVKYQGFIPWDDDVDVALPREDYNRFIRQAQALLPEGVFLQNYHTDPASPYIFSKLRLSNTTYIEKTVAHLPINHGIYIDVFPLDGYPSDEKEQRFLERQKRKLKLKITCVYQSKRSVKGAILVWAERMLGYHKRYSKYVKQLDALLSRYSTEGSLVWCNHGNWQGKKEYAPADQYGHGADAVFEGLQVRVPALYDAYLTQKYGDWRGDPPAEDQVGHHFYAVLDPDRPYTDYIKGAQK